jgi:hypothetical protein
MVLQTISSGAMALVQLYGFDTVGGFVLSHVETLKASENALANRCGEVLDAVHAGFGVGGESSLIVIALGRTLLGGGLAPAAGVATLTNPVTLTCAAIGAIHYGWNALSENEKATVLDAVSKAFSVGKELVRSIAGFALRTIKDLLSKENLAELRRALSDGASAFGQRLGDITRTIADRSRDLYASGSLAVVTLTDTIPARLPFLRRSSASVEIEPPQ